MKDQILSIAQMRHLVSLGVDTSKASMCRVIEMRTNMYEPEIYDRSNPEMRYLSPIPAFTLQDCIEMMPKNILKGEQKYNLRIIIEAEGVTIGYFHNDDEGNLDYIPNLGSDNDYGLLEAAYETLVSLKENKYI